MPTPRPDTGRGRPCSTNCARWTGSSARTGTTRSSTGSTVGNWTSTNAPARWPRCWIWDGKPSGNPAVPSRFVCPRRTGGAGSTRAGSSRDGRSGAVATSGTAHRGQHLMDARTGLPVHGVASVTVVGSSLTWADIDATAAYAHGAAAASWLSGRPGRTGLVVWPDTTTTIVDGRSNVDGRSTLAG